MLDRMINRMFGEYATCFFMGGLTFTIAQHFHLIERLQHIL